MVAFENAKSIWLNAGGRRSTLTACGTAVQLVTQWPSLMSRAMAEAADNE